MTPLLTVVIVHRNTQFTVTKYKLAAHHRSLGLVCVRICQGGKWWTPYVSHSIINKDYYQIRKEYKGYIEKGQNSPSFILHT
jgi:hypothetical protein